MKVEEIARVCHEVNRAYCQALGDDSQRPWEEAPVWQMQSALTGVQLQIDNLDSKPEDFHNSWIKEKQENGWVYGKVKDPEAKTHPCLMTFDELPAEQRAKDSLFLAVVRALEAV